MPGSQGSAVDHCQASCQGLLPAHFLPGSVLRFTTTLVTDVAMGGDIFPGTLIGTGRLNTMVHYTANSQSVGSCLHTPSAGAVESACWSAQTVRTLLPVTCTALGWQHWPPCPAAVTSHKVGTVTIWMHLPGKVQARGSCHAPLPAAAAVCWIVLRNCCYLGLHLLPPVLGACLSQLWVVYSLPTPWSVDDTPSGWDSR
jgi:hypothetical protein